MWNRVFACPADGVLLRRRRTAHEPFRPRPPGRHERRVRAQGRATECQSPRASTASASSFARSSRRTSCHRKRTELRTISSSSAISSGMIGA